MKPLRHLFWRKLARHPQQPHIALLAGCELDLITVDLFLEPLFRHLEKANDLVMLISLVLERQFEIGVVSVQLQATTSSGIH